LEESSTITCACFFPCLSCVCLYFYNTFAQLSSHFQTEFTIISYILGYVEWKSIQYVIKLQFFFQKNTHWHWIKNFWPINKNLAHFAHRFFLTQEKFAHWSKNPGYATEYLWAIYFTLLIFFRARVCGLDFVSYLQISFFMNSYRISKQYFKQDITGF
jgi:hypothetical protein